MRIAGDSFSFHMERPYGAAADTFSATINRDGKTGQVDGKTGQVRFY